MCSGTVDFVSSALNCFELNPKIRECYVCCRIELQRTGLEAWFSIIGSLGIRCADHKLMSKQWAYRVRFVFSR